MSRGSGTLCLCRLQWAATATPNMITVTYQRKAASSNIVAWNLYSDHYLLSVFLSHEFANTILLCLSLSDCTETELQLWLTVVVVVVVVVVVMVVAILWLLHTRVFIIAAWSDAVTTREGRTKKKAFNGPLSLLSHVIRRGITRLPSYQVELSFRLMLFSSLLDDFATRDCVENNSSRE